MRTIIVGVEGSPQSEDAVAFASLIAGATGAALLLVDAFPYEDTASRAANGEYRALIREEAEITLRRARRLVPEDVAVHTLAVPGYSPARALHAVAGEENASLLVVGSTRVGRLGRVVPGSTAEHLLHGAPCPVAVAPGGFRRQTGRRAQVIGVGVDGSPESRVALDAAAAVARTLGAGLRVIGICDVDTYGHPPLMQGAGYVIEPERLEAGTRARVDAAIAMLPDGTAATPVVRAGEPSRELLDQTETLDALFLGSRGYGPLRAVVTGGVSGRVVRGGAACAVVVMPRGVRWPPAESRTAPEDAVPV